MATMSIAPKNTICVRAEIKYFQTLNLCGTGKLCQIFRKMLKNGNLSQTFNSFLHLKNFKIVVP